MRTKPEKLKDGDTVRLPDGKRVEIITAHDIGVAYRHPQKGVCGARWEHMKDAEYKAFNLNENP